MRKLLFLILILLNLINTVKGQSRDTVITYFKNNGKFLKKVGTVDSADFTRITYPDTLSRLYNIREYYITGLRKFMGEFDMQATKELQMQHNVFSPQLTGTCISFYPNGKKQVIANYVDNKKVGLEYLYQPNGHLYNVNKWINRFPFTDNELYWDSYDLNGNMICKSGNGSMEIFDSDFNNVILSGKVKNGFRDGKWQGYNVLGDTVKVILNYEKGVFLSGIGYDKNGIAHPFKNAIQAAEYDKNDFFKFLSDLRRHLQRPKDAGGKPMDIDTVHISFVIDEAGKLSQLKQLGNAKSPLTEALNNAVIMCGGWSASKYYGVPFKSRYIISLALQTNTKILGQFIDFKGELLNPLNPDFISDKN
jgi:antitoxin component YwqK of YwqJK toxin-antitoxin module